MDAEETRPSILRRIRDPEDAPAWREFDTRYRELILSFCHRRGLQAADADDVRQQVMWRLARSLREFNYDRERGRFRNYLLRTTANAMHRHMARRRDELRLDTHERDNLEQDGDSLDDVWLEEWRHHHYRLALDTVRSRHEHRTMHIFEQVIGGRDVTAIAEQYDISTAAVYKIKHRIRDQLSQLIAEQVEDEDAHSG